MRRASSRVSPRGASTSSKRRFRMQKSSTSADLNAGSRIVFGATVDLADEDSGEEVSYQIVGDLEADIKQQLISVSSPFARALIGKSEGDSFEFQAPNGTRRYEITARALSALSSCRQSPDGRFQRDETTHDPASQLRVRCRSRGRLGCIRCSRVFMPRAACSRAMRLSRSWRNWPILRRSTASIGPARC